MSYWRFVIKNSRSFFKNRLFVCLIVLLAEGQNIVLEIDSVNFIDWDKVPKDTAEYFHSWNFNFDGSSSLISHKRNILNWEDNAYIEGYQKSMPCFKQQASRKLAQIAADAVDDEVIIGSDDRFFVDKTTKFPFSAVGMLEFEVGGGAGKCTGTMISEQSFLTSAHCIWDSRFQAFNTDFKFYPGRNGNVKPYGDFGLQGVSIPNAWLQYGIQEYDYAVVRLDAPVGNETGYFGFGYDCGFANNLSYERYGLIGYPFDKFNEQWMGVCNVEAYDPCQQGANQSMIIQHNCDTMGGQSGSVVWKIVDKQVYIRAIHQGFNHRNVGFNNAVAITPEVHQFILRNFRDE